MTSAGSIRGQIRISAKQAIAEYAALRAANATTRTSLLASSAAFTRVGVAALAAAAPIALLFKAAITSAATFQKKIDYFGAVTGATEDQMQAVADKAIQMSRTTVYSADQMADAMVEFGKAGIKTKDILNGVADATVNLAQAADISVGEAANIMAAQLSTFQLGAKGAAHVADILAGAANASIIDIQDIAYSLKYAGGIAASTGVSFDSLVTAISLLGKRGIRGSTAGTSLRMIMVSLLGATDQARAALEKLGIITEDGGNKFVTAKGKIKPLADVFEILRNAEKDLTDAQQLQINKTIFNTRALSAVQILMRDGAKGFRNMQREMSKVTATEVARKRLDNLAGDWTKFKNNIKTTLIQVGGPLQNFMRVIVQGLTHMVQWFGSLSETQQKFIIYGLGIVGVFLAITGILGLTIGLVLKVVAVWRDFFMAIRLVGAGIKIFLTAMRAMSVALLTNPVFLVIAALVALTIAFVILWKRSETFRDIVKGVWARVKGFFLDAWAVIKKVYTSIVDAAKTAWSLLYRFWVEPQIKAVKAVIGAFMAVYRGVTGAISAIINFVKIHWKAIIAIILPGLGLVIDAITTHWKWISNFLATTWRGIVKVAQAVWSGLTAFFGAIWNGITTTIQAIWNGIIAFFDFVWKVIVGYFRIYTNVIKTILMTVWHAIDAPLKAFWNGLVRFFSFIWNRIYAIFKAVASPLARVLSSLWHAISTAIGNIATAIWNGIQQSIGKVFNVIGKVAKQVFNAFNGLYKDMLTVGKNIVIGIWNGIAALSDWLWDKVSHFVKNLWDNVLGFFGIHSPSKKGEYVGRMIVLGLVQGLEKEGEKPKNAMIRVAQGVADALSNAKDQLQQAKADYVNNIRDVMLSIIGEAALANAEIGKRTKIVNKDTGETQDYYTAKSITSDFAAKAAQVKAWANDIAKLKKMGLSPILVDQFIQAGLESMPQVEALLSASKKQIRSINTSYAYVTQGAYKAAKLDSKLMYKAGVDAARGLVNGLKSERRALLAIARKMGKDVVKAVKEALGIRSPSKVMRDEVGLMMMRGLANGIIANKHRAVNAVLEVNKAMVAANTSVLETSMTAVYNRAGLAALKSAAMNNNFAAGKGSSIGVNIEQYHSHNPVPERDSQTLPRKIRQMNYIMPGPAR